jgi:hypothetical protein
VVRDALRRIRPEFLGNGAVVSQHLQRDVAGGEAGGNERLRNFAKLVVACDVPDYAKQVADVGVIREGAGGPFAVEDRDALESCVSAMTGDSGGEVLVGIGETESLESLVDEQQYKGVLSSKKRLLSQLLLVMAFE